ncbi:MAG: di-heme oxidoredictase family protein [Deltaproteobacteria bacterium]|jgi:CxxC motif-containing protein (DUF1111 family)
MKRQVFVCFLVFLGMLCGLPAYSWGEVSLPSWPTLTLGTEQGSSESVDSGILLVSAEVLAASDNKPVHITEAPAGFDGNSNGLVNHRIFTDDRAVFDEFEDIQDGLGPLYNAQSCRECHQNPISGSSSQITELRVGHMEDGFFQNPEVPIMHGRVIITGRSLINSRAICPGGKFQSGEIQERVPLTETIRTFRTSLNLLGDGFVEAVADQTLIDLARQQARDTGGAIYGQVLYVPVLEAPGWTRVGRFGWKNQQASLLSFAADAYLNEMGITSRLLEDEVTDICNHPSIPEPNDEDDDIDVFARFIRATKAPARDEVQAQTQEALEGEIIFTRIGCAICHVPTMVTAPEGTVINGGTFEIPKALGSKTFHPYGDFLLHDVGTGDGIVQSWAEHYGQEVYEYSWPGLSAEAYESTQNKMRTAPLWGVRFRSRLMHDGESLTFLDAIKRHDGEASRTTREFFGLSPSDQLALFEFLKSL